MSNLPMRPHIHQITIAKAMGLIDTRTISTLISKSDRHIQNVLADPLLDFQAADVLVISNYLSDRKFNGVARCFFSPEFALEAVGQAEANGRIDDEITEIVKVLGKMAESHEKRSPQTMQLLLDELALLNNRLKAEMERL